MNPFVETFDVKKELDRIAKQAIDRRASDIHIEPHEQSVGIRLRIDGLLTPLTSFERTSHSILVSRLKILSHLDISEQRIPQDGYLNLLDKECRISICPTIHGEKAVLRLLNSKEHLLKLDELGMQTEQEKSFKSSVQKAQGLILVTGPTGSGKSATLYSALNLLNTSEKNICTIEDPVEIQLKGLNQVSINEKSGLTFAKVLRSFLRQDPDVIMIGEIRDEETAKIACKAAQTGHLVLATLHTNSAIESIQRLLQMGIKPYELSHALNCIVAQRLIRKKTGNNYHGRIAVFELLLMNNGWRRMIEDKNTLTEMKNKADFLTLNQAAQILIKNGMTDQNEINRIL